jgi:hypothetical protein
MKTRDLFAGCSVTIALHDMVWMVSLDTDDQHTVMVQTHTELPDALKAVHEWTLMLSDETVLTESPPPAPELLREALAHAAVGEAAHAPEKVDEALLRNEMQTWFQREMGKSRRDEE